MCVCVCVCMVNPELPPCSHSHLLLPIHTAGPTRGCDARFAGGVSRPAGQTYATLPPGAGLRGAQTTLGHPSSKRFSLYKILFYFNALLWESIILVLRPPTCTAYLIAILLHGHCAIYAPTSTPPPL